MLSRLLAKSPARRAGERLYDAAARQARQPALYAAMGAPDTVEGRFELLTLHVILLVDRLKAESGPAADVRQQLFDSYLSNLDGALREMGVGDLAVGKRMRRLGEAFYGRAKAYDQAIGGLPDSGPLGEVIARTVLPGESVSPAALADYVIACHHTLAAGDLESLLAGEPNWAIT